MKATIDAIAHRLTDQLGLVYRYRPPTACPVRREPSCCARSGWRGRGRWPDGRGRHRDVRACRGRHHDAGLLAEEAVPASGQMIGNFPQAFSHIGLINAAWPSLKSSS
jgi:GH15 family glucan-1,4-alpha-glucosidase